MSRRRAFHCGCVGRGVERGIDERDGTLEGNHRDGKHYQDEDVEYCFSTHVYIV